jgi:hypothetical protein
MMVASDSITKSNGVSAERGARASDTGASSRPLWSSNIARSDFHEAWIWSSEESVQRISFSNGAFDDIDTSS